MTAFDLADDTPLTLAEACERIFHGQIKPSTLRAEARRGRLVIERIGRRDFVTPRAIREMRERCRSPSTSAGKSGTTAARSSSGDYAALQKLLTERKPSASSRKSRRQNGNVVPIPES